MNKQIYATSIAIAAMLLSVACGHESSPPTVATRRPSGDAPTPPGERATVPLTSKAPATTSLSSAGLNAAVDALLREQYPEGFNAAHQCWKTHYGEGDTAMAYCMRPLPASVVTEAGQRVIYVATASAADIEGDPAYRYGAIDPGMFDAFRVVVAMGERTKLVASGKGLDFGSAGDCGCADADLVALGPDIHGWVFSSGGTWQGLTTTAYALVAPVDGAFKDVGGVPQYVEGEKDVEYRMAIGSGDPTDGWFPLAVFKYRGDQKLASQVIHFDKATQRYLVPKSL